MLIGFFLGLAGLFRYQILIMGATLFLWMIIVNKLHFKYLFFIFFGGIVSIFIGLIIDYWFYGSPVFTIYNYFDINIVKDTASTFGVSPSYEYLKYIIRGPGPILGPIIATSIVIFILRFPLSPITWICTSFLFVHSLIPHKEMRFLFPLVFYVPLAVTQLLQVTAESLRFDKKRMYLLLSILFVINFAGLIVVYSKSAGSGKQYLGDFIKWNFSDKHINVAYIGNEGRGFVPLTWNSYYKYPNIDLRIYFSLWSGDFDSSTNSAYDILMIEEKVLTGTRSVEKINSMGYRFVKNSIPRISQEILEIYDSEASNENVRIYVRK